jgi:hypothetical protein
MSHHDRGSGRGGRGNVGMTGRRKWKRPRGSKEEVGSCKELAEAERRGEDPGATAPSPLLHAKSTCVESTLLGCPSDPISLSCDSKTLGGAVIVDGGAPQKHGAHLCML